MISKILEIILNYHAYDCIVKGGVILLSCVHNTTLHITVFFKMLANYLHTLADLPSVAWAYENILI